MAKVELSDFPTGVWDEGHNADLLNHAESLFQTALALDPANPGSNYHLGLISMLKRDYISAIKRLEIAYQGNPNHRGIIKALGYSYLWYGQYDAAQFLLTRLPETRHEVGNYIGWWRVNDRPDLAANAEKYLELSNP
jgi:tetratricopeptide (TPR) repeat protein